MLQPREKVETDFGYRGDLSKIRHAGVFVSYADQRAKRRARSRHERVNNRFKKFNALYCKFFHDIHKHKIVFKAIATSVEVSFNNGKKLFQCRY